MENTGGQFRRKKVYFSQVSNIALRDEELSLKAKGLYSLIQSYLTLEDFTLFKNTLINKCKEGRDGFNTAWKELKNNGYLIQYKIKLEDGTYSYEYELLDYPCTEKPHTDFPHLEKPHTEKPHLYNTNTNNTNLNNTKSSSSSSNSKNNIDLYNEFENNICELKRTTTLKFKETIDKYDSDFILSILEQCCNSNIKSYAGFEKVFNSYLERNCDSRQSVEQATKDYKEKHIKRETKPSTGANKSNKKSIPFVEGCEGRNKSERYLYLEELCLLGQASVEERKEFDEMRGAE